MGGVAGEATTRVPRQTFATLGVEGLVVFNQTVCAIFLVSQSPPKINFGLLTLSKQTGNIRICIDTFIQRYWQESDVSSTLLRAFTLHKQPFYTSVFSVFIISMWASSPQPTGGEPSSETSSPQPTKQHANAAPYSLIQFHIAKQNCTGRFFFFFLGQTVCDFGAEANHSLHLGALSARKRQVGGNGERHISWGNTSHVWSKTKQGQRVPESYMELLGPAVSSVVQIINLSTFLFFFVSNQSFNLQTGE